VVDGRPAAAWLSNVSSDFLATADWHGRALDEVLADLVEHLDALGRKHGIGSSDAFPTGAVSLIRHRDRELDLCLLGDCQVVLRDSRVTVFTDPQFAGVEERLLSEIRREITSGTASADAYARANGTLRERRRHRNTGTGIGAWVPATSR
jgi:hypothetical protein